MYFLVQANDVRRLLITMGIMQSTMGEYSIPAVSNLLLWMFFLIFLEEDLEKIEKFNALKAARPEVAVDTEDYGICR
jgi:hypothetical protein